MTRKVHCILLDRDAGGLEKPPYPGQIGQQICTRQDHIVNGLPECCSVTQQRSDVPEYHPLVGNAGIRKIPVPWKFTSQPLRTG